MKFKTKEKLKLPLYMNTDNTESKAFNYGIELSFKSFAERVNCYKKYRKSPFEFREIDSDGWKLWENKHINDLAYSEEFSLWLFNYCFGDVIE